MEQFIQNILIGVRQWVNTKLDDITYVISSHINELTGRVEALEQGGGMSAGTGITISGKTISVTNYEAITTKLDGIESGAQVNVIESISVNGNDATISGKAASITIAEATSAQSGVMAASDKSKLDGIEAGAEVNVISSITVNGNAAVMSGKDASVTIPEATQSASGVMAAADKTKLDGIASGAQVNVLEGVQVNGADLVIDANKKVNVVIPAATVTGVKSGDELLALSGTELYTKISLDYVSADKKIYLKGLGDAVIDSIDTTDFVKDGMLSYAAMHVKSGNTWSPALPTIPSGTTVPTKDGSYILLIWNTGSSLMDNSAMFIDVTELVDIYTAGAGLQLSGNTFSVTPAAASAIGGVKIGRDISVLGDGTIYISGATPAEVVAMLEDEENHPYPTV